jgi:hypothetical protein
VGKVELVSVWTPIVPGRADRRRPGPAPAVPPSVRAVVHRSEIEDRERPRPPRRIDPDVDALHRGWEEEGGYAGTVTTGLKALSARERAAIAELAPDTDLDALVVIDSRVEPPSPEEVRRRVNGGAAAVAGGAALALAAYVLGRRIERRALRRAGSVSQAAAA